MHPAAMNLESANLKRTQYLLSHYPQYRAEASEDLDLKTSQSVLEYVSKSIPTRIMQEVYGYMPNGQKPRSGQHVCHSG